MAVVITSKFYQEDEWKDISKVVFTSPNMDSPAIAGTRSHILPGQGALGLWYEDTSEMFRIEDHQEITDTDFYNYRMKAIATVNLDLHPDYIDVKEVNNVGFATYVREQIGAELIDYQDLSYLIDDINLKLEYVPVSRRGDIYSILEISDDLEFRIYTDTSLCYFNSYPGGGGQVLLTPSEYINLKEEYTGHPGWVTEVLEEIPECYIDFNFADDSLVRVTAIEMKAIETSKTTRTTYSLTPGYNMDCRYRTSSTTYEYEDLGDSGKVFIGNYQFQGSNDGETFNTIYVGQNTDNEEKFVYLNNTESYKYYRIKILNNDSLDDEVFHTNYYGIRSFIIHGLKYSEDAGDSTIDIYEFSEQDAPKLIKINNAFTILADTPEITHTITDIDVYGVVETTAISGEPYYTIYSANMYKVGDSNSFTNIAECEASTISGVGFDSSAYVYSEVDNLSTTAEAWASFVNPGTADEYLLYTSESTNYIEVSTSDWVGTADVTYTTVASGTLVSGTNDTYVMGGYATRDYESTLYSRRESYRLLIDDTTTTTGIIYKDVDLYAWGYDGNASIREIDMDVTNSIVFELTIGEAYNCRLTAWDDVTHSTTLNELIMGDHVRCSAIAYCCGGSKLDPEETSEQVNMVYPPAHNRIFKGNVNYAGYKYFYGDFDMVYRYQEDVYGDFLIFKPMLYGIHTGISYGVHDYIITLHYSYT